MITLGGVQIVFLVIGIAMTIFVAICGFGWCKRCKMCS